MRQKLALLCMNTRCSTPGSQTRAIDAAGCFENESLLCVESFNLFGQELA